MLKVYDLKLSDFIGYPDDFFLPFVSEETQKAVRRYGNAQVRRTKLLGETMTRQLLGAQFGLDAKHCRIVKGEHGKPYVEGVENVFFNLSHSGDFIVCAISDREIGIDIERIGKVRMAVARRFYHPGEVSVLESLSGDSQIDLFFRYWSVKESFLKYTGSGLSSPLSGFQVCFQNGEIWLEKKHSRIPVYIRECHIDEAYRCFVCSESPEAVTIGHFKNIPF